MNKTGRSKFLKTLLMLALAIVMCVSSMLPAFAADPEPEKARQGTEDEPLEAVITKKLEMPKGTAFPVDTLDGKKVTFTFNFEKVSYNTSTASTDKDKMPLPTALDPVQVEFTPPTASTSGNVDTYTQDTGNFVDNFVFKLPGVYVYTVTENAAVTPYVAGSDEHFVFSQANYTVTFWVMSVADPDPSADPEDNVYVKAVGVVMNEDDNGDDEDAGKIDYVTYPASFVFTNGFYKDEGEDDPEGDDVALAVSKTIDTSKGFYDLNQFFPFEIQPTKPSMIPATEYAKYKVFIREKDTKDLVTITASHYAGTIDSGNFIEYTAGDKLSINLRHNEELVYTKLPEGALYTATELGTSGYTPSVLVTENGTEDSTEKSGTANTFLNTDEEGAGEAGADRQRRIGQDTNSAEFTNVGQDTPITGINMNNLPYLAILLLAMGAFAAFIVVKSRRREVEDN